MRRADRLFQLVGILSRRRTMTATALARELEVSVRTVYRDVFDLIGSGVPILGEAGVGYRLDPSYRLPSMTFTPEEIEALVLGMRMVESFGDADLKVSSRSILDKVSHVIAPASRARLSATALFSLNIASREESTQSMSELRRAINQRHVVQFTYEDRGQKASRRRVKPLGLYFWGRNWTLASWCLLRTDFRNFRIDRVQELYVTSEQFELVPPCTLDDYVQAMQSRP